jgi:wyosine [tRNA(Phe)-imidazoG37] synthetase (radical SAM superfamily)
VLRRRRTDSRSESGDTIAAVKECLTAPVAVLTNSSLIVKPEMRAVLGRVDSVAARLDAPTGDLLGAISRPVEGIRLQDTLAGIRVLRNECRGRLAVQMMFFNVNRDQAKTVAAFARELRPDEVEVKYPPSPLRGHAAATRCSGRGRGRIPGGERRVGLAGRGTGSQAS